MKRKRLILSSLDQIDIGTNDDIEFIGPCCLINNDHAEELVSKLDDNPIFNSHNNLKEASDYIIDYSNRLMVVISEELNKIHGTEFSVKYWSILLMPWLISITQLCFERFQRLNKKLESDDQFDITLVNIQNIPKINSTIDGLNILEYQEINQYIYSVYIQSLNFKNINIVETKDYDLSSSNLFQYSKHSKSDYFKRELWRRLQRNISVLLSKSSGYYIDGIYGLSLLDNLLITIKTKHKKTKRFLYSQALKELSHLSEPNQNNDLLIKDLSHNSIEMNNFEKITNKLICRFIPQTVLSNYKRNLNKSKEFLLKTRGKTHTLVIGPLIGGYEPMKFIAAIFKEFGGKLIISQHGSNYGFLESFAKMAAIEYQACDEFITWGWRKHSNYELNTKILPSPLMSKIRSKGLSRDKRIITLVSNLVTLQGNNLASIPEPNNARSFRNNKVQYLENIKEEYLSSIRYKPYMPDHRGLPDKRFFSLNFPKIEMIEKDLIGYMKQSRLVVIDHPGTTMLEAFSMNVPVIVFMNQEHWGISNNAKKYFDDLIKAEILHLCPKSAAQHTNKVLTTGRGWWHQEKVQRARIDFCEKFANSDPKWMDKWVNFLNEYH